MRGGGRRKITLDASYLELCRSLSASVALAEVALARIECTSKIQNSNIFDGLVFENCMFFEIFD